MDITGAILAGGHSRRMAGAVKPLLRIADENGQQRSIYDHQRAVLSGLCQRVVVSAATALPWADLPVVVDQFADAGPMAGIHRVLTMTPQWALIVAGDMPYLRTEVLQLLVNVAHNAPCSLHAIAFEIDGRPQPLCAMFHCGAVSLIAAQLHTQQYKVASLLTEHLNTHSIPESSVRRVDPQLRNFHNVNTVADIGVPSKTHR